MQPFRTGQHMAKVDSSVNFNSLLHDWRGAGYHPAYHRSESHL